MTPIKFADYLKKQNSAVKAPQMVDLREFNLVKAAPVENGRPVLTLRFDTETGTLKPAA
ncbi:MAG: hypothetical protein GY947_22070 [Rhodobacteraceae bacterium]|nr:hypothetical protein [Paracoccaceae bacterium]